MGRLPINNSDNDELKKGPWTPEEDQKLIDYVQNHGHGSWQLLPKKAGLNRCGKSCRLRWTNYLRPDIKRGSFSPEEEQTIVHLHSMLGNKWATIATRLPGRTDNEIKNYWNTQLRKKLMRSGIDPKTHQPITHHDNHLNLLLNLPPLFPDNSNYNSLIPFENLAKIRILSNILQVLNPNPVPTFLGGSQQNFNQVEGLFHGMSDHPVQFSSVVPNMEDLNLIPTNFQPICNTFKVPDELNGNNKSTFCSSSSNTNSEYSLPALVPASDQVNVDGVMYPDETQNYDVLLGICSDSVTSWETVMDDEASSSSFWKDIFSDQASSLL